ncbi:MAG: hypothetical protein Q8L09_01380 [Candidatus Moranbacteria bacterium]|nr:hypothetical protein [Candidatus Moranbacteria bacterium]
MKKKTLFLAVIFAGTCFFLANRSLAATDVTESITAETIWNETGSPYLVYGTINVNAPLIINPGTIVKFQYYGIGPTGMLSVKNELNAVGTPEKPIIFTSMRNDVGGDDNHDGNASQAGKGDWYGVSIYNNSYNSKLEHVLISNATTGLKYQDYSSPNYRGLILRNSEIKDNEEGIKVYNTLPIIENNKIEKNKIGITAYTSKASRVPTFHNNTIEGNAISGLDARDVVSPKKVDAKHNWWGDAGGPANPATNGNRVLGSSVMLEPWLSQIPGVAPKKPVILVPGIGASVNWDYMLGGVFPDNWSLMSHTYDGIIEAFKEMDYEEGKNFFVCYYDWRNKNAVSAENYLKPIIDEALRESGAFSVNIVAHSMGGLVARSYIQSAGYENDVENLIMIGTPNKGSSDVYPVWEGGRIPNNWEGGALMRAYLHYIDIRKLTFSNHESVHQFIPSVKELLPVYNYLHPVDNPNLLYHWARLKEINEVLPGLNSQIGSLNERVKVISISGNNQATVNKIPFIKVPEENPLWLDGKPEPIDPARDDVAGDKRVLLSSSQIQSYFSKTFDFDHGEIVDQSENIVADLLGENLREIHPSPEIRDELAFWFASPVDVEIEAPNGKIINKDIENSPEKIPLAIYSGESKPDGFKFISIPKPIKGDYKIKLTGNGEGPFHGGSIYTSYENEIPDQESPVEGNISAGEEKKYKIEYNPENLEDPVGEIVLADTIPPTITGAATSQPNANGWYNSNVTVHFSASDAESEIESVTSDVTISTEGANQSATGTAIDKAGNSASFTVTGINIDKTSPVIKIVSPENKNYLNDNYALFFSSEINDPLSGVETSSTEKLLKNKLFEDEKLDLSLKNMGNYNYQVRAKDKAGNPGSAEMNFQITTDIDAIQNNINHYFDLGLIKKKIAKRYLAMRLAHLKSLSNLLEEAKNNRRLNAKAKEKLVQAVQKEINRQIGQITKRLNRRSGRWIDPKAAELLIESLSELKKL